MNKRTNTIIEEEVLRLRLVAQDDLDLTREWRNKSANRVWFRTNRLIEVDEHRKWYENYKYSDTDYVYLIELKGEKKLIGQVSIYNVDWEAKTAEFGRLLSADEDFTGKGYYYQASLLLLDYWKKHLLIEKFHMEVKSDNIKSIKLCSKLGFCCIKSSHGYDYMVL